MAKRKQIKPRAKQKWKRGDSSTTPKPRDDYPSAAKDYVLDAIAEWLADIVICARVQHAHDLALLDQNIRAHGADPVAAREHLMGPHDPVAQLVERIESKLSMDDTMSADEMHGAMTLETLTAVLDG